MPIRAAAFALYWCSPLLLLSMTEPIRLAKRLAEMLPCSRSQAEQYIAGGWVRVDGRVVESPQHRVTNEKIELDRDASLLDSVPMTVLLHKPAGFDWSNDTGRDRKPAQALLTEANRSRADKSGVRLLKRHLKDHESVTPLEFGASGLIVFTQDFSIKRKLWDDRATVENEFVVDVTGDVTDATLNALNRPVVVNDRVLLNAKVSVTTQAEARTGLRFAVKGGEPGRIATACERAGLAVVVMKRIRVGRVPMAGLEPGQWRFLLEHERF
jgi:23S rRNA pseudouridine2604 synthase